MSNKIVDVLNTKECYAAYMQYLADNEDKDLSKYYEVSNTGMIVLKQLEDKYIQETTECILIEIPEFVNSIAGYKDIVSYNHNGVLPLMSITRYKGVYPKSVKIVCKQPVYIAEPQLNGIRIIGDYDLSEFNFKGIRTLREGFSNLEVAGKLTLNSTLNMETTSGGMFKYSTIGCIDFNGAKVSDFCSKMFSHTKIACLRLDRAELSMWKGIMQHQGLQKLVELNETQFREMFKDAEITMIIVDSEKQVGIEESILKSVIGADKISTLELFGKE